MKQPIIALFLFVISGVIFAADSGPYVGLNMGQSSTDNLPLSDKNATAVSVVGGYQFNRYLGVEVQYTDFGSVTFQSGGSSDITGIGLSVVGSYPFTDKWSAFLRVGATHTEVKSVAGVGEVGRCNANGGVGGQYNVTPALGIRLSYDSYGVGGRDTLDKATTSLISMGVVYKF